MYHGILDKTINFENNTINDKLKKSVRLDGFFTVNYYLQYLIKIKEFFIFEIVNIMKNCIKVFFLYY